jgi:hypothetical protein
MLLCHIEEQNAHQAILQEYIILHQVQHATQSIPVTFPVVPPAGPDWETAAHK